MASGTSQTLRFVQLFGPRILPWIILLRPIGPLLQPSLTWLGLNFMLFLLILDSIYLHYNQKPEQAEPKHNRRNMGINHKIMQINPKIESKSIKIPCIYDTYHPTSTMGSPSCGETALTPPFPSSKEGTLHCNLYLAEF